MGGIDPAVLAGLFAVAVMAGCVDAIAGGGGLLNLPALLLAGLPPVNALATNKLQGAIGTLSAVGAFARRRLVDWRSALPMAAAAGCSALLGPARARLLSPRLLEALVPLLLIGVALYFGFGKAMASGDRAGRLSEPAYAATVAPAIGFYDGIFGPGAGAFYMASLVSLVGFGALKATAHTKVANAASNVGGLAFFAASGAVHWVIGLTMAVGAIIGAQIGSRLAIRLGARLIRPLLVLICCLMAVKLLANPGNPLRLVVLGLF